MNAKLLIIFSFFLYGCTATNINKNDPTTSKYAPSNGIKTSGETSYCDAGLKSIRNHRRQDAYMKMYKSCGGSYKIIKEEKGHGLWCAGVERRIWFKCGH